MNLRRITMTGGVKAVLFATVMVSGFFLQMLFPLACLYAGTLESLTKAAGKGDAVACFRIGLMYDSGSGVGKNREEAEKWFKKGEELIDPLRMDIIKLAIGKTKKLPRESSDAVNRYRLKAEKGDTALQLFLGSLYTIPQVQDEAVKWYRLAAEGNCAYAQFIVAQLLDQEDEKIVWYQRAGENGYVNAYEEIGDIQRGKKNYTEMLTWYRLAADKGSMTAVKTLAVIYEKGEGIPKDAAEAIRWYGKLAEQDGEYGVKIARFYHAGKDVPRDMAEALRWYRIAAGKGEEAAFKSLIALYESGKDMPRDMVEALKWHVKLAEMDPDHYVRVADIYRFGQGVPVDIKKALAYYQMALEKSEGSDALEALGDLYSEGKDIAKDIPQLPGLVTIFHQNFMRSGLQLFQLLHFFDNRHITPSPTCVIGGNVQIDSPNPARRLLKIRSNGKPGQEHPIILYICCLPDLPFEPFFDPSKSLGFIGGKKRVDRRPRMPEAVDRNWRARFSQTIMIFP